MTTPDERLRSMGYVRDFLHSLLDPKETPRVPLEIRRRAARLLKHYPSSFDVEEFYKPVEDKRGVINNGK